MKTGFRVSGRLQRSCSARTLGPRDESDGKDRRGKTEDDEGEGEEAGEKLFECFPPKEPVGGYELRLLEPPVKGAGVDTDPPGGFGERDGGEHALEGEEFFGSEKVQRHGVGGHWGVLQVVR